MKTERPEKISDDYDLSLAVIATKLPHPLLEKSRLKVPSFYRPLALQASPMKLGLGDCTAEARLDAVLTSSCNVQQFSDLCKLCASAVKYFLHRITRK